MSEQAIEFVEWRERRLPKLWPDAFSLREDRPHQWLQRICLGILRKLGCQHVTETVEATRHTIYARTFMERLFKQRETLVGFFNRQPKELLIGAEDYAELMRTSAPMSMFQFNGEYGFNRTRCGLAIRVIPWMRGIVVMP